jgi:hypothetical protein
MKRTASALTLMWALFFSAIVLNPITFVSASSTGEWIQTYGGHSNFYAESFVQAGDGGFVIAGWTESGTLLLKTDYNGNIEWNRTYGGTGSDVPKSLIATSDEGYALLSGTTLVKTDAQGNVEWNSTLSGGNEAYSLIKTSDGGYAIAGSSGDVPQGEEPYFWLVKTDEQGHNTWSKTYETVITGGANSVIQTIDGGFAMLGSNSFNPDFLLVKTSFSGELEWSKKYEKPDWDTGSCILQNIDGGYMLAGSLWNRSGTGNGGLIRTDSNGDMLWMKNYPGGLNLLMAATSDGGYVLCSNSTLFKTDSESNTLWTKDLNLPSDFSDAWEFSVIQTQDGGYAVLGDANISSPRADSQEWVTNAWIAKTDPEGNIPEFPLWTTQVLLIISTFAAIIARNKRSRMRLNLG